MYHVLYIYIYIEREREREREREKLELLLFLDNIALFNNILLDQYFVKPIIE